VCRFSAFGLSFTLLAALAGCAGTRYGAPSTSASASYRRVPDAGIARYTLALGQVSSGAALLGQVMPDYPPALLAACPPLVEVRAQLIVDEEGRVREVRVADEAQADPVRRLYIAATRKAALQWTFQPLHIERWAADAQGNSHRVDDEVRPFSLVYVFAFQCVQGRGSVSG
jgi:hypothetical protein